MKNLRKRSLYSLCGVLCALLGLFVTSCIPQKHIVLVQDVVADSAQFTPSQQVTETYRLQPNDYLFINVSSPNPELSAFYNPATSGRSSSSNMRQDLFYYGLNDSSEIDFPVVGKICLKDCTVEEAKEKIREAISASLTGFTLTVRLATNNFSILGEVVRQGAYTMPRNQITIFEAVSMAGGFTSYAKRSEVKVLRKNDEGKLQAYEVDMTHGNFIESEVYYIYPNDIVYVRPLWFKVFGFGETISLGLVSALLSLYLVIRSI